MNLSTAGSSVEPATTFRRHNLGENLFLFCREKPLGALAALLLLLMVLAAAFAETLATYDPIRTDAEHTLAPPDRAHWFGTDILQGLPLLVLAMVMAAALGPSIGNVIVAISVPIIPRAQRVIRGSVLAIREFAYIEAARALGIGHLAIAFRHILPNTVGPFIVLMTAQFGSAILVEAALSFLGLGVPEPYPSWGRMLSVSAAEFAQKAPWMVLFPGTAISLVVFASNLLGDAVRDKLDPRLRGA
jgi:ABC-type dipeptide/oligopeptide/nickel transport system permease subunit